MLPVMKNNEVELQSNINCECSCCEMMILLLVLSFCPMILEQIIIHYKEIHKSYTRSHVLSP